MFSRGYRGTTAKPSLLGFGCMRLPRVSEESQEIDFEKAERLIDEAYAAGVNYYDTAYVYHDGKSEGFLKRALAKYPRESYFLADKMPSWHLKMPAMWSASSKSSSSAAASTISIFTCATASRPNPSKRLKNLMSLHISSIRKKKAASAASAFRSMIRPKSSKRSFPCGIGTLRRSSSTTSTGLPRTQRASIRFCRTPVSRSS